MLNIKIYNVYIVVRNEAWIIHGMDQFKTDTEMENYLCTMENIWDRTALSKFRLSNHDLMIEKGRHQGLEEQQRHCPFCENTVETEQHFLME